ncbi:MAG: MlaD family protein [Betaproteobacteria bacterium]
MSQKANYFKLGLFVIASIAALITVLLIIGTGRFFERRITIETYFTESVQGLDIGSKLKLRGVVIGEVTKISFTYVYYQLDMPMAERHRYVLVEAQLQSRLVGGRAAAGDLTNAINAQQEVDRGLRLRLAPQGITGTSYLEMDYVDPPPAVLPISWTPNNVYIPSAPSTVMAFVNAAQEILSRLQNLDIEGTVANVNKLLSTVNQQVLAIDAKGLSERTNRTLSKLEQTLDAAQVKKVSTEATALLSEMRQSNAELGKTLANPAWQKIPVETSAAMARVRELVSDPKLAKTIAGLERITGRLDRVLGGAEPDLSATFDNLRQITENLRELTEDTKRYPANVIFGGPPPQERKP